MNSNAAGNVLAQLPGSEAYEIIGIAQGRFIERGTADRLETVRETANSVLVDLDTLPGNDR